MAGNNNVVLWYGGGHILPSKSVTTAGVPLATLAVVGKGEGPLSDVAGLGHKHPVLVETKHQEIGNAMSSRPIVVMGQDISQDRLKSWGWVVAVP